MKKPKKITIKFFLNEHIKPIDTPQGIAYPLYCQITYNRKNTHIKCNYGGYYTSMESIQETQPKLLPFEEYIFRQMMDYEVGQHGELLDMKGLGTKYDRYSVSIHALFSHHLKARLQSETLQAQPQEFVEVLNYHKKTLSFQILLRAAEKLFDDLPGLLSPEFHEEITLYQHYYELYKTTLDQAETDYGFPLIIDWVTGTHPRQLETLLQTRFDQEPELIKKMMTTIHRLVCTKLEIGLRLQ
ncbi:hypothetical protein [Eisenibacter elegans]|jgi:hypothetical protein|uniref:hypothetical protein n=1 Tax=Eisenibacter elegans TaxID=997 RepID=UPI0004052892|nr:hypothetical protein [Eisenibacter elegans]